MDDIIYCPLPEIWSEIHQMLLRVWQEHVIENPDTPKPPTPLILV